jgi:hypothetical protein
MTLGRINMARITNPPTSIAEIGISDFARPAP